MISATRVVDTNTWNLDPDPEFWPNWDRDPELDPGPGICYSILRKEKKLKQF